MKRSIEEPQKCQYLSSTRVIDEPQTRKYTVSTWTNPYSFAPTIENRVIVEYYNTQTFYPTDLAHIGNLMIYMLFQLNPYGLIEWLKKSTTLCINVFTQKKCKYTSCVYSHNGPMWADNDLMLRFYHHATDEVFIYKCIPKYVNITYDCTVVSAISTYIQLLQDKKKDIILNETRLEYKLNKRIEEMEYRNYELELENNKLRDQTEKSRRFEQAQQQAQQQALYSRYVHPHYDHLDQYPHYNTDPRYNTDPGYNTDPCYNPDPTPKDLDALLKSYSK
jgi:regulator of replication initiation timing